MAWRANGAGGGGKCLVAGFDGLRDGEERRGADGGDGTAVGESNGNLRRSNVVREFGDGEEVVAAGGEKGGVDGAAKLLNGSANYGQTVLRALRQLAPSLIGETYLETVLGHSSLFLEEGKSSGDLTLRRCDPRVKTKEQM